MPALPDRFSVIDFCGEQFFCRFEISAVRNIAKPRPVGRFIFREITDIMNRFRWIVFEIKRRFVGNRTAAHKFFKELLIIFMPFYLYHLHFRSAAVCRSGYPLGGYPVRLYRYQHIFAPAGILSSRMMRLIFSSPFSLWMEEISIPLDSRPIILRGGRFTMARRVLPTRSSGA